MQAGAERDDRDQEGQASQKRSEQNTLKEETERQQ